MSDTPTPSAEPSSGKSNGRKNRLIQPHGSRQQGSAVAKLAAGAIGIVFGDIGTSPIYAFRETFVGAHPLELDRIHVLGVVSLIFWSMTLVVSIQYVTILMRADNKGQGGSLALVAQLMAALRRSKFGWVAILLGVFATSLFYGDSMITPAISVLSAVEGLTVVESGLQPAGYPYSCRVARSVCSCCNRAEPRKLGRYSLRSCLSILPSSRFWDSPRYFKHQKSYWR